MFADKASCHCICFFRDTGGIGTQVGNQSNSTLSFDIYSFIQLLSQTHCLLGRKVQCLGSFLLQSAGSKWKRSFFTSLSLFYFTDLIRYTFQFFHDAICFFSGGNRHLLFFFSVELCNQRFLFSRNFKYSIQWPVFFRNKCIDFFLSVRYNPQRNGLYPTGTQSTFDLFPQHRTDPVTNHTVQDTSCLLFIHQIHIYVSGMFDRLFHCAFGDLIKSDSPHLFFIQLQCCCQMPGNRFSLTVRVSCEIYFICLFCFFSQTCQQFSLSPDRNIFDFSANPGHVRWKLPLHNCFQGTFLPSLPSQVTPQSLNI